MDQWIHNINVIIKFFDLQIGLVVEYIYPIVPIIIRDLPFPFASLIPIFSELNRTAPLI